MFPPFACFNTASVASSSSKGAELDGVCMLSVERGGVDELPEGGLRTIEERRIQIGEPRISNLSDSIDSILLLFRAFFVLLLRLLLVGPLRLDDGQEASSLGTSLSTMQLILEAGGISCRPTVSSSSLVCGSKLSRRGRQDDMIGVIGSKYPEARLW